MLPRSTLHSNDVRDPDSTVQPLRNTSNDAMTAGALELQSILTDLDLQEYFNDLVEEGFDTWDNVIAITETDMATLGMKLGHRRKLQSEIALRRGSAEALSGVQGALQQTNEGSGGVDGNTQEPHVKRRYRRRNPRDPNAPTRPDTAYVAYTKAQRQQPEVANLPFIEIAKLVGDRWTHLPEDVKDVWNRNAQAEKDQYRSAVADYRQTKAYREHRDKTQSMFPSKAQCEKGAIGDNILSQNEPSELESDAVSSATDVGRSQNLMDHLQYARQVGSEATQGSFTSPASTDDMVNSSETSWSRHDNLANTSVITSNGSGADIPAIDIIWNIISQETTSKPENFATQISHDDLLSYNFQQLALSRSFHVQSINPFHVEPQSRIRPILDRFLQNVNEIYYLIDPDDLLNQLELALDPNLVTPNFTLSIVCICIAIGYQTLPTVASEMAIMWYENGRRYLDDCDWNLDPTVMQILALISMFHMAQRPATSSHYLDSAIRIGEANNFHRTMEEINHRGDSQNVKWLDIWNTMVDMNRILVLGSVVNDSIICTLPVPLHKLVDRTSCFTTYRGPAKLDASLYRFIRVQSSVKACVFGNLFDILGAVQQQLGRNSRTTLHLWEARTLIQELETWLQSLPNELSLPTVSGLQRTDPGLLENIIKHTPDARKLELLHLYSLYFGILNLLMWPSFEQIVRADSSQATALSKEDVENAYRCVNCATRSIDFCAAFFRVSPFPVFAWLPQCVLFSSSLICVLGILWQRQLLARETTTLTTIAQERLDQNVYSTREALRIFEYCAVLNGQCERHRLVLQRILEWLQQAGPL